MNNTEIENLVRNKYNKNLTFNSFWISKIINLLTKHTTTQKIENKFLDILSRNKIYTRMFFAPAIFSTIKHQKLLFKILRVQVAGRVYQLPTNFALFNRYGVNLRYLLSTTSKTRASTFSTKVTQQFFQEPFNKNTLTTKMRNETYKTLMSFRGYLHFRWRN